MSKTTTVTCPKCGNEFNVEDVLAHGIEEKFREKYNADITTLEKEYKAKQGSLEAKERELKDKELQITEQVEEKAKTLTAEREIKLREKILGETEAEKTALLADLTEARGKLADSSKISIENERLKQQLNTQETELELKYSKLMTTQLQEEVQKAQKAANDAADMKLREANKKVEVANEQVAEMKRKLEQGSVQLQGEVQELAIEEWLTEQFPLDTITEIKKGVRGADCLQIVNTRERINCGKVYYESKRTKDFHKAWIAKFKEDMRAKGADIGVLVTEVMPPDMDRMGTRDGILICTFDEFKAVCHLLRDQVIAINAAVVSQEGKGDKMTMIYDYLTGNEFRMSVEAIVEAFTQMKGDLESEKRAFKSQWAKREKQIDKVIENTMSMFGSIRGLGGNEIQSIPALEVSGMLELESGNPSEN